MTWRDGIASMYGDSLLAPLPDDLVQSVRDGLLQLTRAECRVAMELLRGTSNERIAQTIGLSRRTIEEHVASIVRKCGCTRLQFMRICCGELARDSIVVNHVLRSAAAPRNASLAPMP